MTPVLSDGAGAAVSTQPSDEHPGDLDDARTRAGWDESTDDGAGLDEQAPSPRASAAAAAAVAGHFVDVRQV